MSPVSPALAENLAAEVVGHYQEAERQLLERISRNLAKGIDAPHWAEQKYAQLFAYQKQTERLIADLRVKAASGVSTAITTAYERGGLSAVADMSSMGVPVVEHLAGLRAVEAMAQETLGYVNATHPRILRSTMDAYRAAIEAGSKQAFVGSMERVAASEAARTIVAEKGAQVLLGTQTRRQATQAALDAFAKKGITGFIDKSGRGWNLESYVETAMRTGCGNAAVQGHVDRLTENGLDLVIVSDAPRECPTCRPWEGKVLSIGGVLVEMPPDTDAAFQVAPETPAAEVP